MAENKKSVLIYVDLIHTVEQLDDVDAGLLFKHFLRYVNDLNPEPPSKLVQIVFEPWKQNLKRDLVRWESKRLKYSENAKKRWDAIAMQSDAIALNTMQNDAVLLVNDNVNVNANVNVNVIKNKKEILKPTESEFLEHAKNVLGDKFKIYEFSVRAKFKTWVDDGWRDGHGEPIKNWKNKLSNTIPHLKPFNGNTTQKSPIL